MPLKWHTLDLALMDDFLSFQATPLVEKIGFLDNLQARIGGSFDINWDGLRHAWQSLTTG